MSWCKWKLGRLAYAPGNVGTVSDADGEWWQLAGPFYWLLARASK
jgi:hypothetical protein